MSETPFSSDKLRQAHDLLTRARQMVHVREYLNDEGHMEDVILNMAETAITELTPPDLGHLDREDRERMEELMVKILEEAFAGAVKSLSRTLNMRAMLHRNAATDLAGEADQPPKRK